MPDANERRRTRILVVDDHADTARSMALLLEHAGFEVETAGDGPWALAAACRRRPDFVLLDLALPGMDGYEVARRLRQDPACRDTVIIAVTGHGQPEDRRQSRAAGIDHHLLKPVEVEALLSLLSQPGAASDAEGGSPVDAAAASGGGVTGASSD
jgi:CheY-like chemotaxis protein